MLSFTKDEMREYVEKLLQNPETKIIEAKKNCNIHAVPGIVGEEIITYPQCGKDEEEIIERQQKVEIDPKTKRPGWVVTTLDRNDVPVVNGKGHLNQYIIKDSKFTDMYELVAEGTDLYIKREPEKFIQIGEDIHFGTENGEMTIQKGGYIKITNMNRISGIAAGNFEDSYVIVNSQKTEDDEKGKSI